MDLDNILFAAFAGRAAPESYAGEVFDPANEKAWIKDYVRALDGAAAIRNISVHLMRTPYEPMDDIAADLAANRDKAVSYVVSDSPSGELDANIVKINTAALLRAASTGKSSLVAMGNYTYRSFDGIPHLTQTRSAQTRSAQTRSAQTRSGIVWLVRYIH
jgi:hypothetical protein